MKPFSGRGAVRVVGFGRMPSHDDCPTFGRTEEKARCCIGTYQQSPDYLPG